MLRSIGKVYGKLRRQNKKDYFLLFFCCFLSVLLIGTYGLVMQSHTVLNVLPEGGDSRKQMFFIFYLTMAGCIIFVNYASGLFFQFKSRECGIFLALGARRSQIRKLLFTDIAWVGCLSCLLGTLLATPLALGIWKLFQIFLVNTEEMQFSQGPAGYLWSAVFSAMTILVLFVKGSLFVRRTNILDVINEQRKSEPIRDVRSWYGWVGILLIFTGGFAGYLTPNIFINVFRRYPPAAVNLLYLLLLAGVYLLLLYTVIRGWSRRHSYKNIISRSIMKFQGRQTVRNMCIVTLLTAGGLFAMFYTPTMVTESLLQSTSQPYDCIYHYRMDEDMITREETFTLAEDYFQDVLDHAELPVSTLAHDGFVTTLEEDNRYVDTYYEMVGEISVLSASSWEMLTGTQITVPRGTYIYLTTEGSDDLRDEITRLTNYVTKEILPVSFLESMEVHAAFTDSLLLNDADFASISQGLTPDWQENLVCFNLSDPEHSYTFCKALENEIIDHSSPECEINYYYDRVARDREIAQNGSYFADTDETFQISYEDRDSINFRNGWKYIPRFASVSRNEVLQQTSVFLMTFIFIFLVCLLAVFVILYTRSLTVGLANRQVYSDLKHLGAGRPYLQKSIRSQISKVVFLPTGIGTAAIFAFYCMILFFNSYSFTKGEFLSMGVDLLLIALLGSLLYLFYRRILQTLYRMLDIQ